MELSKQSVLLIGGGEVAERKLDLLLKANAKLTIISPQFTDYILDLIKNNKNNKVNVFLKKNNINNAILIDLIDGLILDQKNIKQNSTV